MAAKDNKLLKLTSLVLDQTNWYLWSRDIQLATKALSLWHLLGNHSPQESENPNSTELSAADTAQLNNLHHALNQAMDPYHRVMKMHCQSATGVWSTLKIHYESKMATDVMIQLERFDGITLNTPIEIPRFLNDIKVVHTALSTAVKGFTDDVLTLKILSKLPVSMANLKKAIQFGHPDMQTPEQVASTLTRYHQTKILNQTTSAANEFAAWTSHRDARRPAPDKSKTECNYCGARGHWKAECKKRLRQHPLRIRNPSGYRRGTSNTRDRQTQDHANIAFVSLNTQINEAYTEPTAWVIDTAATASMSPNIKADRNEGNPDVMISDGRTVPVTGTKSAVRINPSLRLNNVLVVPQLHANLLSISGACADGTIDRAVFEKDTCTLWNKGELVGSGTRQDRLYLIETRETKPEKALVSIDTWHQKIMSRRHAHHQRNENRQRHQRTRNRQRRPGEQRYMPRMRA